MSEIKPLGSEKLNGDEKLKRILELTYYNSNNKKSNAKAELVKESKTGGVYGIVKEKDGYYIKRGLNEQSLDYIGGMFMKNKNRCQSYGEAFKKLEFIQGQEALQEDTKYVLKKNKPQGEAPMDTPPVTDAPVDDTMGSQAPPPPTDGGEGSTPSMETPPTDTTTPPTDDTTNMGGGSQDGSMDAQTGKRSDYMAEIQKFSGKLGQELRDQHDRLESDDIKYVLNMILSAINLDKLSDEDRDEISKKFEKNGMGDDSVDDYESDDNLGGENGDNENGDNELGEESMDGLKDFINMSAPSEHSEEQNSHINLKDYADLGSVHEEESADDVKEIDMDEIKREINQHINGTLSKYFK